MAWAIRHAAWLHTRFQVHATGKTSFFPVHLTGYTGAIVQFAECVWARDPTDVAAEYKLDSRWRKGIWLGKVETSDEHIVGLEKTIMKVRVVKRCPEGERWDRPRFQAFRVQFRRIHHGLALNMRCRRGV